MPADVTHLFKKNDFVHYAGESRHINYWAYGRIVKLNRDGTQADVRFDDGACTWVNDRDESWIKLENVQFAGRDPTIRQQTRLVDYIGELRNAA